MVGGAACEKSEAPHVSAHLKLALGGFQKRCSQAELVEARQLSSPGRQSAMSTPNARSQSTLRTSQSMGSFGGASTLSNLNGTKSTKSSVQSQVLSHKSSAPSFSFGSGPARIQFTGAAARGPQTLQPSVASGGDQSPGPIYNPAPSRKWLGDAAHAHFGTQDQRPSTGAAAQEISKLTGKSNTPGPGSYSAPSSVGRQALARCYSTSSFSFGTMKQRESAAKSTPSPGPVYTPNNTRNGGLHAAEYSFGNEIRTKNRDPSLRTPGPGVYNQIAACASQPSSELRSSQAINMGVPSNNSSRGMLPLAGRHSPGPIYMNAAATGKQQLSWKRTGPRGGFSRAERFGEAAGYYKKEGPGPGEYVV